MVRLEHPNELHTDWPIRYDNGSIAYDSYKVPRDGQRATKAAYKLIDTLV